MFEDILKGPEEEIIEATTTPEKYCGYCTHYKQYEKFCIALRLPKDFFTASCRWYYKEID